MTVVQNMHTPMFLTLSALESLQNDFSARATCRHSGAEAEELLGIQDPPLLFTTLPDMICCGAAIALKHRY